jgi:predicted permease
MNPFRKIGSLFRKRKLDADMAEEMRLHLEMLEERKRAAGMSDEDARYAARREFGGVEQIKEQCREQRSWVWLEQAWRDLRHAVRGLRKAPGFTSVIVLTLAFGVGVNTALFTWFNAAAFRPLPVPSPEYLFALVRLDEKGVQAKSMSYPEFSAYRSHQTVFSGLVASAGQNVEWIESGGQETRAKLRIETVSANYFAVFDVPMTLGRPLVADDETSTRATPVIVLSHHFWQRQLDGDPGVVGRTMQLRGLTEETLTVVGVAEPEFFGTKPGALAGWVPLLLRPGEAWRTDLKDARYTVTGRLRPGTSRQHAAEELQAVANNVPARFGTDAAVSQAVAVVPASTYLTLTTQHLTMLLPMICLFGAVFIVSCANASNLILARAVTRRFEFAVRSALGATRRRLFTQIMTESLLLGSLGGLVGWGVAAGLLRFAWPWLVNMVSGASEGLAGLNLHADYRVFGFTLAISLLAGAAGGLFPALQVTRRDVNFALKQEASIFGRRLRLSRVRRFLTVAQFALSSALLFIAALLVHRALGVQLRDLGFDQSRLVTFEVLAPRTFGSGLIDAARRQVLECLRALPAVAEISEMRRFPFAPSRAEFSIPSDTGGVDRVGVALHLAVPANYFSTLQLPLIKGRAFAAGEIASDQIAVISESAARELWPDGEALGRHIEVSSTLLSEAKATGAGATGGAEALRSRLTVIGVVRDTRVYDPWFGDRVVIFLPLPPQTEAAPYLLVRTQGDAKTSLPVFQQVGREATGIDPRMMAVSELFAGALIQYRVTAWVAGILACLSLFVAVVGLYGVTTFAVNQREREIGIRIALGATPNRVVSEIVCESLRIIGVGAALGYSSSVLISNAARTMLFGVSAVDPLACVVVTLLLSAIGLLASWLPARRAARVDPMVALRCE